MLQSHSFLNNDQRSSIKTSVILAKIIFIIKSLKWEMYCFV